MAAAVGRRALLAGGVLAAAAGCSADPGSADRPGGATTPPASASASASASAASSAASSASAADWAQLARGVDGSLALPASAAYDTVRLTPNPRYDGARPLAVLSVASAQDVAAGLRFARDHGVPVAVRSGGHSYPGWSAGAGRLVIDVRPLADVTLDGTTATIGAGASLVSTYAALAARGRGIAAGSCASVGIAGLTLGGGVGVLTRAHGLTCDAVTSMQVVLADGRVVTASADAEPDLFWALRGGGGGHLGVVTSLTTSTFAAPTLATAYLAWPVTAADRLVPAFLDLVPAADPALWATCKLLGGASHPDGPTLLVSATRAGSAADLDAALRPLLAQAPAPTTDTRHVRGYLDQMLAFAGCTAPDSCPPRVAFAATSHVVVGGASTNVGVLLEQVQAARDSGLTEAGVSIDALGGVVDDVGPTDTAFGHRGALATVQYTATYAGALAHRAQRWVDGFRGAMTPSWGTGAYVNYAQAGLADYRQAYFGANAARLAQVRAAYDPDGLFTQPQDY